MYFSRFSGFLVSALFQVKSLVSRFIKPTEITDPVEEIKFGKTGCDRG